MKQYLHLFDYAAWIAIASLQWLLVAIIIRNRLARVAPSYTVFISFVAIQSAVLFGISQFMPYAFYFWAFYLGAATEAALMFFVVYEVFRNVFDPLNSLPPRTVARAVAGVAIITAVSITLGIWKPAVSPDALAALARTFQRTSDFVVALSFWSLVIYARRLGVPWRSRMAGIAAGFLFFLTIQSITTAAMGFTPKSWFGTLSRIGILSYLGSLLLWVRAVHRKEENGELPTPEALLKLAAAVEQIGVAAGRLSKTQRKTRWQAE